ncbi:MAG: malto-oligosyltrehalose trehalohydrolase [Planctomyces sp.]|nr:malto-oligosyltrehalose trehalohydrolase [Planctomyces sp.]
MASPAGNREGISVWAPFATDAQLEARGERSPLERDAGGWWRWREGPLRPGEDYAFRIDGDGPFPDPRSPWQPAGVHGPSRVLDHDEFVWSDAHFQSRPLGAAVLYELHVGTFTSEGTFESAIARLDHLVNLGVTHVQLMPVAEFLGDYGWGYDGVCPYAPHDAYGGPNGLKTLVNACHQRGLGVLLDVVYNHLGPSGNYLPRFGPYLTGRYPTPWGSSINFDGPYSDEVREYFIGNALMWLRDYHIDGLRLDAVHAIVDLSATHFLEELATRVDELKARLGRHLILIAESDLNDPRIVRPWELGGFGLDAQWSDDIHHALHTVLTGERTGYYSDFGSLADLAASMTQPYVYAGQHSQHRQRRHGRPVSGLSAHRFLAYLQNHDQLGNRARGERMAHLTSSERAKLGAALILLSPYVPMLFQGEEWGASSPFEYFVDFASEPELGEAVRSGRMREFASFGWSPEEISNPTDRATFERSKLKWREIREPAHAEMHDWYRQLIALRHRASAFTTGRLDLTRVDFNAEEQWICVHSEGAAVACNFDVRERSIPVGADRDRLLLASRADVRPGEDGRARLPGETVAVFGDATVE